MGSIRFLPGEWHSTAEMILRILLTLVFSSIIGWERSSKRHSAGLRTIILVSLTGTAASLIDEFFIKQMGVTLPIVSAAVVIGAVMLSGNSILFSSKGQIKGLTTSAGVWMCTVIGVMTGLGLYIMAIVLFITLFVTLAFFDRLEKKLKKHSNHFEIHLELKNRSSLQDFAVTVRELGLKIDDIEMNPAYLHSGLSVYSVSLTILRGDLKKLRTHTEMIKALRSLPYIAYIEETL